MIKKSPFSAGVGFPDFCGFLAGDKKKEMISFFPSSRNAGVSTCQRRRKGISPFPFLFRVFRMPQESQVTFFALLGESDFLLASHCSFFPFDFTKCFLP